MDQTADMVFRTVQMKSVCTSTAWRDDPVWFVDHIIPDVSSNVPEFLGHLVAILLVIGGVEQNPGPDDKARCELCGTALQLLMENVQARERAVDEKEKALKALEESLKAKEELTSKLENMVSKNNLKSNELVLPVNVPQTLQRIELDQQNPDALILAAASGKFDTVKFLVQIGIDTEYRDENGMTALLHGAEVGNLAVVHYLVHKSNADIYVQDYMERTALHWAASNGHTEVVDYLLRKTQIDIEVQNHIGRTAFHLAVSNGYLDVIEVLALAGADIYTSDLQGETTLDTASERGYPEIVEYLLNTHCHDKVKNSALLIAAQYGNDAVVEVLLEAGAMKDTCNARGETALHISARAGHLRNIEHLVGAGCDLHIKSNWMCQGRTALHEAASNGHYDIMYYLLNYGTCPRVTDSMKETALHCAAQKGHLEMVQLLIEAGGDVNAVSRWFGRTPLHDAATGGHTEVVKFLLSEGALLEARMNTTETPLLCAADSGHYGVVTELVLSGCNIQERWNWCRRTALHLAARNGNLQMVKFLLNQGGLRDWYDTNGETALFHAARNNHVDVVTYLVEAGADAKAENFLGSSIFLITSSDAIKALISASNKAVR